MTKQPRIAVVGGGVSGLTLARLLAGGYDVTLYEAAPRVGGHAMTIEVPDFEGRPLRVDAGVCMFYSTAYPAFFSLLKRLGIPTERSEVTFELLLTGAGRRYHLDLNRPWLTLLNELGSRERSWLVQDGARFYAHALGTRRGSTETLGEYLASEGYSETFRLFLSFLCGATWTLNQQGVDNLPLEFFFRTAWSLGFIPSARHGSWHHVSGSVGRYLDALSQPLQGAIRLGERVERVERRAGGGVTVYVGGRGENHDQAALAVTPAAALELIAEPTPLEQEVLGTFRTQQHTVVFTSDAPLARSWTTSPTTLFAASDVASSAEEAGREFLFRVGFADMRRMCGYPIPEPYYMWYQFPDAPRPGRVHATLHFSTPCYTREILAAQARHGEISGRDRLHFLGTSWGNGIHEGAVGSALVTARAFGRSLDDLAPPSGR